MYFIIIKATLIQKINKSTQLFVKNSFIAISKGLLIINKFHYILCAIKYYLFTVFITIIDDFDIYCLNKNHKKYLMFNLKYWN